MKVWQCVVCGFVYDEAVGLPAQLVGDHRGDQTRHGLGGYPRKLGVSGLRRSQGRF